MIKILHICSSDHGGAAKAAFRLHEAMLHEGLDSCFMSLDNQINDGVHYFRYDTEKEILKKPEKPVLSFKNYLIEKLTRKYSKDLSIFYNKTESYKAKFNLVFNQDAFEIFSTPFSNYDLTASEAYQKADVIHLHWVAGYLDYPSFFEKNSKPVVWTLHDENPFRGGFHYKLDELNNGKGKYFDLDQFYKKVKFEAISKQKSLTIVTPSKWLEVAAKQSQVFQNRNVRHIYYTLNQSVFKKLDKGFSRDFFNIPRDKIVFMFVAQHLNNKRKGFELLFPIIEKNLLPNSHFLIVGENSGNTIKSNITFTGTISDERIMAMAYNAADYFVLPSKEDNLPNTMLESISCGTPIIAFPIGDFKEIIEEGGNGFLAKEVSSSALADLMKSLQMFSNDLDAKNIREYSLEKFNRSFVVEQYLGIYNQLL